MKHRPTYTEMTTAISEAVAPLAERVSALQRERDSLRQALDGRARAGVLPYTKSKTEAAREMLLAGKDNKVVGTTLGLSAAQVKQIKYRMKTVTGATKADPDEELFHFDGD